MDSICSDHIGHPSDLVQWPDLERMQMCWGKREMPPNKRQHRNQNSLMVLRFLLLTSVQVLGSLRLGHTCDLCLWVMPHCLLPGHPTSCQRQNGLTV